MAQDDGFCGRSHLAGPPRSTHDKGGLWIVCGQLLFQRVSYLCSLPDSSRNFCSIVRPPEERIRSLFDWR